MSRRNLVLALSVLASACSARQAQDAALPVPNSAMIYVIARGWHTDIGLPAQQIAGPLTTIEKNFPSVSVLTFGFGERQFLITGKTNPLTMLKALLPSQSALLVTALRTTPQTAFGSENVVALPMSQDNLNKIEAKIWHQFETSAAGDPVLLADGPYPGSVFYAARDTYDGFNTCNTWTAQTLRAGSLPMTATGVLFAGQVMGMARWIAARHATPETELPR